MKSDLTLTVSAYPICLKDLLLEDELLELNSNHIVKALLAASLELCHSKLVVRSIEPHYVLLSADFKKIMFSNLRYVIGIDEKDDRDISPSWPYSAEGNWT